MKSAGAPSWCKSAAFSHADDYRKSSGHLADRCSGNVQPEAVPKLFRSEPLSYSFAKFTFELRLLNRVVLDHRQRPVRGRRWLRDQSRSRLYQKGARVMRYRPIIFRPSKMKEQDAIQADQAREVIHRALEVLRSPTPDTFLGRKTQEPFPFENDA
jgi:hypothetical protein